MSLAQAGQNFNLSIIITYDPLHSSLVTIYIKGSLKLTEPKKALNFYVLIIKSDLLHSIEGSKEMILNGALFHVL